MGKRPLDPTFAKHLFQGLHYLSANEPPVTAILRSHLCIEQLIHDS